MAAIPATRFSQFARQLHTYAESGQFSPLLQKSYAAFEATLKLPSQTLCDAFKKRYHIPIDLGNPPQPFSAGVMQYIRLFRKMFPSQKVEAQPYHFQIKKKDENPFTVQWELMRDYIGKKDLLTEQDMLTFKLTQILVSNPSFEHVKEEMDVLLDTGAIISKEAARSAILANDPRFLDFLLARGYRPTLSELDRVFWLGNDIKAERVKKLVAAGVTVDASDAPPCHSNLNSLELHVALGSPLTSDDLKGVLGINFDEKLLPFLRFFKDHDYRFTEAECIDILGQQFAHHFNAETTKAIIEIICPEGQLTSVLLHQMRGFTHAFIAYGYIPTFQDLEEAMKDNDESAVIAFMPSIKRKLTIDETVRVLSSHLKPSLKTELLQFTPITQELFRAAFVAQIHPNDVGLIINLNQHFHRVTGSYSVTHDDIEFAINRGVHTALLKLMLQSWNRCATKILFRTALKKGNNSYHLGAFLETKYTVDAEDFRHACNNECSEETFWRLLNYGLVKHGRDERLDSGLYTRRKVYQWQLHTEKAGYIPTQEDLDYAREKGLPENVLKLIEGHLSRKPFEVWQDREGNKQVIFIGP